MCLDCGPLIKAIDRYIQKADDDLEEALGEATSTRKRPANSSRIWRSR